MKLSRFPEEEQDFHVKVLYYFKIYLLIAGVLFFRASQAAERSSCFQGMSTSTLTAQLASAERSQWRRKVPLIMQRDYIVRIGHDALGVAP